MQNYTLSIRAGKFSLVWWWGGGGGEDGGVLIKFYMYHHRSDEEKFRQRTSSVCTVLITLKKLVAVIPPKYKGEHNYSDQLSLLFWVRVRIYKNKNL